MKDLSQPNAIVPEITTEPIEQSHRQTDRILALQGEFFALVARYNRHFAGKTRPTRDLRQLDEFIAHLRNLKDCVRTFPEGAETIVQERISQLKRASMLN